MELKKKKGGGEKFIFFYIHTHFTPALQVIVDQLYSNRGLMVLYELISNT